MPNFQTVCYPPKSREGNAALPASSDAPGAITSVLWDSQTALILKYPIHGVWCQQGDPRRVGKESLPPLCWDVGCPRCWKCKKFHRNKESTSSVDFGNGHKWICFTSKRKKNPQVRRPSWLLLTQNSYLKGK